MRFSVVLSIFALFFAVWACKSSQETQQVTPDTPSGPLPIKSWISSADGLSLLAPQGLDFAKTVEPSVPQITIDENQRFQEIDGFGYTLTGSSAMMIQKMGATNKANLLQELFGKSEKDLGISYLRLSLGASDLDTEVFSYNDLPAGVKTNPDLRYFNLSKDTVYLIPLLKEILAIRPELKLMASPWSPPVWMKSNGSSIGGRLKPEFYGTYARYFVRYLQAMQAQGIKIEGVTLQNEPQHGGNNPSMEMTAKEQAEFVKNHLGPAFRQASLNTKIIVWDHNCDHPEYPIEVLNDPAAKAFIDGSAFHMYGGDASALSKVKAAHPDKNLYFTEQWTGSKGEFGGDLRWHLKNIIIGTLRNHSRTALEWNLANDPAFSLHSPGGCTECKGALTIDGNKVNRNVSYYIIAHASKVVPPGSIRLGSNENAPIYNVAFVRPDGKKALIVLNDSNQAQTFYVKSGEQSFKTTLPAAAVMSVVF
jgi:glucosylceramidase